MSETRQTTVDFKAAPSTSSNHERPTVNEEPGPIIVYRHSSRGPALARLDDADLMELSIEGEDQAFETLMDRYMPLVVGGLYGRTNSPQDTEELAQEVFVTLWRSLTTIRKADQLPGWLKRVTRSKLCDYYRALKRRPVIVPPPEDDAGEAMDPLMRAADPRPDPAARASAGQLCQLVVEALNGLGDKYKTILMLRLIGEETTPQIARQLKLKETLVQMRLFRGLQQLRKRLKRLGVTLPGAKESQP